MQYHNKLDASLPAFITVQKKDGWNFASVMGGVTNL
jgi:hypothetical protein